MSFWEKYRYEKPQFASEIISLGLDFSSISDNDAKERCFALETTAKDSNCSICELKEKVMKELIKIDDQHFILLLDFFEQRKPTEAVKYHIAPQNTIWAIVQEWILEKVEEIEQKYAHLPSRSTQDFQTLFMYFKMESSDEVLSIKKTHIYKKKYPMTDENKKYVSLIENIMDSYFEHFIRPFASNPENHKNPDLFNLLLSSQVWMYSDKLINKDEDVKDVFVIDNGLIEECNSHNVSIYAELYLAGERIKNKYKI